ncbi:MAG: hypothetical protein AB7F43_09550 [Bacteriovoracia bacterium]
MKVRAVLVLLLTGFIGITGSGLFCFSNADDNSSPDRQRVLELITQGNLESVRDSLLKGVLLNFVIDRTGSSELKEISERLDQTNSDLKNTSSDFQNKVEPTQKQIAYAKKLYELILEGKVLELDLSRLVEREKYPGAQGKGTNPVSTVELEEIEVRVLSWAQKLNSTLKTAVLPNSAAISFDVTQEMIKTIHVKTTLFYFSLVGRVALLRLRILDKIENPLAISWQDQFSIDVPLALVEKSFADFEDLKKKLGTDQLPFILSISSDVANLRINPYFLQGVELSLYTANITEDNALALMQLHASRRLLENFERLRYLSPAMRGRSAPRLPKVLYKKFKSLKALPSVVEEQQRLILEDLFRQSLVQVYRDFQSKLPSFVGDGYSAQLYNLIKPKNISQAEFEKNISELEVQAKLDYFSNFSFVREQNEEKKEAGLADIIAHQKALSIWMYLVSREQIGENQEQVQTVLNSIFARKLEYRTKLESNTLKEMIAKAHEISETEVFEKNRLRFAENLLKVSKEIKKSKDDQRVIPQILYAALQGKIQSMLSSGTVQTWVERVFGSDSWTSAKEAYFHILESNIHLTRDKLSYERIQNIEPSEKTGVLIPKLRGDHGKPSPLALELAEKIKKDVQELSNVGQLIGFHNAIYSTKEPTVIELLKEPSERKAYSDYYDEMLISQLPVLGTRMPRKGYKRVFDFLPGFVSDYWDSTKPPRLYDVLSEVDYDEKVESSIKDEVLGKALTYVDPAIENVDKNIREQLQKLGEATTIAEAKDVFLSSFVMTLFTSEQGGYSVYSRMHEQMVSQLLEPHILSKMFRSSDMIWWPVRIILSLQLAGFASKFFASKLPVLGNVILASELVTNTAYYQGYSWALNYYFLADIGAEAYSVKQTHDRYLENEKIALTSGQGAGLNTFDRTAIYRKMFEAQETQFLATSASQLVLMGLLTGVIMQIPSKLPVLGGLYDQFFEWIKTTKIGKLYSTSLSQWAKERRELFNEFKTQVDAFKSIEDGLTLQSGGRGEVRAPKTWQEFETFYGEGAGQLSTYKSWLSSKINTVEDQLSSVKAEIKSGDLSNDLAHRIPILEAQRLDYTRKLRQSEYLENVWVWNKELKSNPDAQFGARSYRQVEIGEASDIRKMRIGTLEDVAPSPGLIDLDLVSKSYSKYKGSYSPMFSDRLLREAEEIAQISAAGSPLKTSELETLQKMAKIGDPNLVAEKTRRVVESILLAAQEEKIARVFRHQEIVLDYASQVIEASHEATGSHRYDKLIKLVKESGSTDSALEEFMGVVTARRIHYLKAAIQNAELGDFRQLDEFLSVEGLQMISSFPEQMRLGHAKRILEHLEVTRSPSAPVVPSNGPIEKTIGPEDLPSAASE